LHGGEVVRAANAPQAHPALRRCGAGGGIGPRLPKRQTFRDFMPSPTTTHLLVDGSNVVRAWADTRALARRDREGAKALLVRRLAVLRDFSGWRVTVVFDGRGEDLNIEAVDGAADFACVHTPAGATADDVIEQLVGRAAEPGACLVATADQAERATVEAAGAAWCSPEELARRIDAVDTRQARAVARGNAATERDWREGGKAK
jgi:predicted RNA-binding protein with PIN domain